MDEIEIMALSTVLNCTEQIFLSAKVQGGNGWDYWGEWLNEAMTVIKVSCNTKKYHLTLQRLNELIITF